MGPSPLTTWRSAGSGPGLYICREIVRAHGGKLSLDSSETAGTTFTVSLPRSA
jgi:signal transduction histidine kinase